MLGDELGGGEEEDEPLIVGSSGCGPMGSVRSRPFRLKVNGGNGAEEVATAERRNVYAPFKNMRVTLTGLPRWAVIVLTVAPF